MSMMLDERQPLDERITVNVTPLMKKSLMRLAISVGISFSDIVRVVLQKYTSVEYPEYLDILAGYNTERRI